MAAALGEPVQAPPSDGVTCVRFAPRGVTLLASSWDGTVTLFDASNGAMSSSYAAGSPLLDATFQDESAVLTAGLDGHVKRFDFVGRAEGVIGRHEGPVRCVEWLSQGGLCASASWDKSLRFWDTRSPQGQNAAGAVALPGKAFSMSHAGPRLLVATSTRQIVIVDTRSLANGILSSSPEVRDSSLKYQTRCVRCFPDGTGYALSSVEGRVAVEYFDYEESIQARKYAFKCHRKTEGGRDLVYPVNAIAFHPLLGTFATGGCDGVVNVWDGDNKKRLCQVTGYPSSVASLAFSSDGRLLAVASSYTYELGDREHPRDEIFIRPMSDADVAPKPRK
eukprot:jgi/Botrbrau1/11883/Bobra.126_2s0017.1